MPPWARRSSPSRAQTELEEPDTPQHHSLRQQRLSLWLAWLSRHGRAGLLLLLLLLVGFWLLTDPADVRAARSSVAGRTGKTRRMLPDGDLVPEFDWQQQRSQEDDRWPGSGASSLLRAEEFGLDGGSGTGGGSALERSRAKWGEVLAELSVQPLTVWPPWVDRSLKVVLLTPRCCELRDSSEEQRLACMRAVMQRCPADTGTGCLEAAAHEPPCPGPSFGGRDPRLTHFMALQQLLPVLRELGWEDIQAVPSPAHGGARVAAACEASATDRQAAAAALASARLILADVAQLPELLPAYTNAWFIGLDPGPTGTLPAEPAVAAALGNGRLLAVWKAQLLLHPQLHNGPLLAGAAHLAKLPGASGSPGFQESRQPLLPARVIAQSVALLSHAFRFRNPLECGGHVEHLRFAGAFLQNDSHWRPPVFAQRATDVGFIRRPFFGEQPDPQAPEAVLLRAHVDALERQLAGVQRALPRAAVSISSERFGSYAAYLARLQDTKILVSPTGLAEWSEADFEAVLCGCLLLKADTGGFAAYPHAFLAGKHVLEAPLSWARLEGTVQSALQDLEHSERMARRATLLLLEFSEVQRYAGEVNRQLEELVRRLPLRKPPPEDAL